MKNPAAKLVSAKTEAERKMILAKIPPEKLVELAHAIKDVCYANWTSQPAKAQKSALALKTVEKISDNGEIKAVLRWVSGISDLTKGKFESAVENLDLSEKLFFKIGEKHAAAQTQVARLIVLSLLGKTTEAIKTGEKALKIFENFNDELAAGKIEKNLGNIIARQGNVSKSEKYYLSAIRRFKKLGDWRELAMCETNLAETYTDLNQFRAAEKFYRQALETARRAGMFFVEAEIEASMGNLAMFRGRYDDALNFLETARRKFEELKIPHRSAIAKLEIADIYSELNLTGEAFEIYDEVAKSLQTLKLRGEEARARASLGKTAVSRGEAAKARRELKKSAKLFVSEKNAVGAAEVKLTEANLELSNGNYKTALKTIAECQKLLAKTENLRLKLFAGYVHGEILRNLKQFAKAEKILLETYETAIGQEQSNLAQSCLTALGNLCLQKRDSGAAEKYFLRAVKTIENLREPLPAEEFRMAFLADKIAPYENLLKIYLAENKLEKAFAYSEKARSRSLAETVQTIEKARSNGNKSNSKLIEKLNDLREELNWFYSRLGRADESEINSLQSEAKKREKQIAELTRQIESTGKAAKKREDSADENILRNLQKSLGRNRAMIEFVCLDNVFSAFVITENKIDFVADLAKEDEIVSLLEGLRFQFGALRYGAEKLAAFSRELKKRADFYLERLFDKLLAPLFDLTEKSDLIVVPVGAAHYVPFPALRRAGKYLIETREINVSPSALVWQKLAEKPSEKFTDALLFGFADEKIPLVNREIKSLQKIFDESKVFIDDDATFANYTKNAQDYDVLHIACHGQFRPENPMFSSLHLADGWITVRDICAQNLKAGLVTLSACETGLNKLAAGGEILGLTRGFLSAGASSLILSLWTVSDAATTRLMENFYKNLQRGDSISASLAKAQRKFIEKQAHPYYWSPFVLIGK